MRRILTLLAILAVVSLALFLRLRAAALIPVDYDEDDYLGAAQRYAGFIRQGDLQAMIDFDYNYEHPLLTKLVYAAALLPLPEAPLIPLEDSTRPPNPDLPAEQFLAVRRLNVALSTLQVLLLALLDPFAGLFLGMSTYQLKYSVQIMLEALPSLFSALAALAYLRWLKGWQQLQRPRLDGWLALSGLALGVTVAAKYTYGIAGLAILLDAGLRLWQAWRAGFPAGAIDQQSAGKARQPASASPFLPAFLPLLAWGGLALLVFFALDPRLWNDPAGRLLQSLTYHVGYAQSAHVTQYNLPAWQPLVYLAGPVQWHPGAFIFMLDLYVTVFAVLGLRRAWRQGRVFVLWLLIGLVFLIFWPTKWPQYILMITTPLAVAAGLGFRAAIWEPLGRIFGRARAEGSNRAAPAGRAAPAYRRGGGALPWLLPGALFLSLLVLFPLIFQGAIALTDFNAISIRDGLQGGVFRAVWGGLSGQEQALSFDPFEGSRASRVRYAGPSLLLAIFGGGLPDLIAFNVLWVLLSVGLSTLLGIGAAMLLNQPGVRLRLFWQALFILPWAIPEFVGALVWLRLLEPKIGWLYTSQRLPAGIALGDWASSPEKTLFVLLVAGVWTGFPFIMLAAIAGLKLAPPEVYDAAAIDGAGGWRLFRSITWPLLLPLVAPAIIIRAIFAFNQFYLFISMQTEYPSFTFATLSYYVFNYGGQYAVSAALNLFTVGALVLLVLGFDRLTKASEGVTYA
jgi:ABC-type sugar transport system permease subunit